MPFFKVHSTGFSASDLILFFPDFQTSRVAVHGLHVDARRTQMSLTAGRVLAEGNLEPVGVEVPREVCVWVV